MDTFITVIFVILIVGWFLNQVTKGSQAVKGAFSGQNRSKCAYCGKGLKSNPNRFGYATFCSKCGREQPWASENPV